MFNCAVIESCREDGDDANLSNAYELWLSSLGSYQPSVAEQQMFAALFAAADAGEI